MTSLSQAQVFFLVGTVALPALLILLHTIRTRITLGPFFGVAGVYSLMQLQLLQTGWWVSFTDLQFNTALTLFIPPLILGFLLTLSLDGLRPARAYTLMVLTTSIGGWLFSVFRESLAQQVPLPYLIVLSNREHLAIILGLLLAQIGGMITYSLVKERVAWLALPGGHAISILIWLACYSSIEFDLRMGLANIHNEWAEFLTAAVPSITFIALYGVIADKLRLFMPVRAWRHLFSFWRATQSDTQTELSGDAILNRDLVISELKLLNQQLADSGQVMETHMREAIYGIIVTDDTGRVRRTNKPARELLGTPNLEGMVVQNVLARRIANIGTIDDLVAATEGKRYLASTSDTRDLWLEIQATRLKGEGLNAGYYLIVKDVTTSVAKENLQLVSSRVRDLYQTGRVLAHDFSNLLIGAQAQLIQLKANAANPEGRQSLFAIESALQRAREMVQQLGTGTQFGSPRLSDLSLGNLVDESVAIVRAFALASGIKIERVATDEFRVEADASQMVRVFTNLIRNAIRASTPGDSIAIRLQRSGKGVEVSISDQGQGMTSEQLAMAFDPGFSTKEGGQGGLGLAISYLMTEAHGGHLELRKNEKEGGISAIVWLPEVHPHPTGKCDYDNLAGLSVILAMPQEGPATIIASELQRKGCLQVAEVYSPEELHALLLEDSNWQVVLVAPDFNFSDVADRLPSSIKVRCLKDPYT